MIKKIDLEGFQIHENTSLTLTPGVNIIAGPSDNGKSSVIRALRLILTNKPTGMDYVRHGDPFAQVAVTIDDVVVRRIRGKNINAYGIDGGEEFRAMGSSVPEEISDLLNIAPHCVQSQFDPYFLLPDSPGEVGRKFNEIAKLTDIDEAIKKANGVVRQSVSTAKTLEGLIEEKEQALTKYTRLPVIRRRLEAMFLMFQQLKQTSESKDWLETLVRSVHDSCALKEKFSDVEKMEELAKERDYIFKQRAVLRRRAASLYSLLENVKEVRRERGEVEAMASVAGVAEKRKAVMEDRAVLLDDIRKLTFLRTNLLRALKDKENTEIGLEECLAKMEDQEVCPLCLKKL